MNIQQLTKLCMAWPGVTSDVKWGNDLVFSVAGKMFAAICIEGSERGKIGFKVDDDLFLSITEQPGIIPAPYAARYKWVAVVEPKRYDKAWYERHVRRSYELVGAKLTKKTRAKLMLG